MASHGTWDGRTLTGTGDADVLVGTTGDDVILGLDGDDQLIAAGGFDSLYGGDGDDILIPFDGQAGADWNDLYDGGDGHDVLRLGGDWTLDAGVLLVDVEEIDGAGHILQLSNAATVDLSDLPAIHDATIRLTTWNRSQTVIGQDGADRILWNNHASALSEVHGGDGDDVFIGRFKNVYGGAGFDTLRVKRTLYLGAGHALESVERVILDGATIYFNGIFKGVGDVDLGALNIVDAQVDFRFYVLNGRDSPLIVRGTGGDDRIEGDNNPQTAFAASQTLYGGAGDDRLDAGHGTDKLFGGDGDDVLIYERQAKGRDLYDGGSGFDTLSIRKGETLDLGANLHGIEALASADRTVLVPKMREIDLRPYDISGLGRLVGSGRDQTFHGWAGVDRIDAGSGEDVLFGGEGDDLLDGGAGIDRLFGGAGDDLLTPGEGRGLVDGGAGLDVLRVAGQALDVGLRIRSIEALDVRERLKLTGRGEFDLRDWTLAGETPTTFAGGAGHLTVHGVGRDETFLTGRGGGAWFGRGGDDSFALLGEDVHRDLTLDGGSGVDTLALRWGSPLGGGMVIRDIERLQGPGERIDAVVTGEGVLDLSGIETTGKLRSFVLEDAEELVFFGTQDDDLIHADLFSAVAGGDGDDVIVAANLNVMAGGAGADLFKLSIIHDDDYSSHWRIVDFESGVDTLRLAGGFEIAGNLSRPYSLVIGEDVIYADIHGDRRADVKIELPGAGRLDPDDLVL